MQPSRRDSYLTTDIRTAPPQKLHLILIEAAIRFSQQAREHMHRRDYELASDALVRAKQIVTEMLCNLRPEHDPELTRKVAGLYMFVFRSLTAANLKRDESKLAEALSILEAERETWRQVCAKLTANDAPRAMSSGAAAVFNRRV